MEVILSVLVVIAWIAIGVVAIGLGWVLASWILTLSGRPVSPRAPLPADPDRRVS